MSWIGGYPKCLDCKKTLISTTAKRCLKCRGKYMRGDNSPMWKGGDGTHRHQEMGKIEYKLWREAIFKRDNYTCQVCQSKGVYLEADHIKPWSTYPELRYAIDNGKTLCQECHKMKTKLDHQGYKFTKVVEEVG